MAWLAVSSYGTEYMFHTMPIRAANCIWNAKHKIMLPKGSIKKLIGRELSWSDNPVELK